jgi:hypothetical protein
LKTVETTRCLQRDLANAERTSAEATLQAMQASILRHQTSGLKKPELDEEHIEKRDQNRPNQGQQTISADKHTNCEDLKIIYRSGKTNSH